MTVLRTRRLILGDLSFDDAKFIVELLNDDSFLRYIGDKGVRTIADAQEYLRNGPMDSYRRHGFGLLLVRLLSDATRIGICGLVQRSGLDYPDVGFALLPEFRRHGYASEAAAAVIEHARTGLALKRILGITNPANHGSIRLLERAGFAFERRLRLLPDTDEINLYLLET